MAVPATSNRVTVNEYHAMADRGELDHLDRVELLNGRIIEMPPIGPEHADSTDTITELLVLQFAGRARTRVQNPITLGEWGEPIPDYALVRLPDRRGRYRQAHPGPDDIYLLIEVADSSERYDLGEKARTYAAAGIADYWVVLVRDGVLKVHRGPTSEGYRSVVQYGPGVSIAPLEFPDSPIAVSALLG